MNKQQYEELFQRPEPIGSYLPGMVNPLHVVKQLNVPARVVKQTVVKPLSWSNLHLFKTNKLNSSASIPPVPG